MSETCRFCSSSLQLINDDFVRETKNGKQIWQKIYQCEFGHTSKFFYIPSQEYDLPIELEILDSEGRKVYA